MNIEDTEAVRRVIVLYGHLLDDGDFERWGALFAPDAEFWSVPGRHLPGSDAGTSVLRGREKIVTTIRAVHATMHMDGRAAVHYGGAPVVEIDGDRANATWSFFVLHTRDGGADIPHAGRYHATLERLGDGWRFLRRLSVQAGHAVPDGWEPA